jgi:hypothetical protein
MAFLCTTTFLSGGDGKVIDGGKLLELKLAHALHRITRGHGRQGTRDVNLVNSEDEKPILARRPGLDFPLQPRRLEPGRDGLRTDWVDLWKKMTIEYSDAESGASIYIPHVRTRIGPFFLDKRFSIPDFEKILLHEFLHAAFIYKFREAHHGMMEQVLVYNIGYPPPANPVSVD